MDRCPLSRRSVLKSGVAAAATLAGLTPARAASPATVFVVTSVDHRAAVRRAVELLGGMSSFVRPGASVMLKPNMGWAREPKYAANTNPNVMAELTRLALDAGAGSVGVTDNSSNDPRRSFSLSGIAEAVGAEGGNVFYSTGAHYKKMNLKGRFLSTWPIHTSFAEADVLINAPVAKHHGSTRVTLGMKNWMGAIGGGRGFLHGDLDNAIADLAGFFRPSFTIIDCTRVLMRGGPTGGNVNDVVVHDAVVASLDPVAADAVACSFLDVDPGRIGHITEAARRGIGTGDAGRITVVRERA